MDLSYPHGKENPGLGNVVYRDYVVEWGDESLKEAFAYTTWWQRPNLIVCRERRLFLFFGFCSFCFFFFFHFHSRDQEISRSYYNFMTTFAKLWEVGIGSVSLLITKYWKIFCVTFGSWKSHQGVLSNHCLLTSTLMKPNPQREFLRSSLSNCYIVHQYLQIKIKVRNERQW